MLLKGSTIQIPTENHQHYKFQKQFCLVFRMYRDMRLTSIGGGADEVMLGIISKYMGTLPVPAKKKKPAAATTTAVEQGTATAHNP